MLQWDNVLEEKWLCVVVVGRKGGEHFRSEWTAGLWVKLQAFKSSVLLQVSDKENGALALEQKYGRRASLDDPIPRNVKW